MAWRREWGLSAFKPGSRVGQQQTTHHKVELKTGYRLILSLVICWLRQRTSAEKYTGPEQKIRVRRSRAPVSDRRSIKVLDRVDSQKEARATGSRVVNPRSAVEPLARFTLRTQKPHASLFSPFYTNS